MSTKVNSESLKNEHDSLHIKCVLLCKEIVHQLDHLLEKESIKLAVPIQSRAKSWNSIVNKIEEGRFTIKKTISELQDLSGIRIILLFQRDVSKVTQLIDETFNVIKKYNTEDRLSDNQFGYSSVHVISRLPDSWLNIPTFSNFNVMQVEIQVRTLSQHSWAEASNILNYKKEESIPKPLRRSISRISALLETVDLEYERLLNERIEYKHIVSENFIEKNVLVDAELNVDLLEALLDQFLPKENKHEDEDYSVAFTELKRVGIDTKLKLIDLINEHLPKTLEKDKQRAKEVLNGANEYFNTEKYFARAKNNIFYSHIGLLRNILRDIHGDDKFSNEIFAGKLEKKPVAKKRIYNRNKIKK